MNPINNGGPAFPTDAQSALEHDHYEGMTLRDYFAARYMQGMCGSKFYTDGNLMDGEIADHAYAMADAMLKAREA